MFEDGFILTSLNSKSFLITKACPGFNSFTFSHLTLNAVWITGLSEVTTKTSSSSYQKAGLIPLGSLITNASPCPMSPAITYPPSQSIDAFFSIAGMSMFFAIKGEISLLE